MKRPATLIASLLLGVLSLWSQGTTDFAERFMELHAGSEQLQCITVGPNMMEKMLKLTEGQTNPEEQQLGSLLAQCKSLRIVKAQADAETWRERAVALLEKSRPRYRIYTTEEVNADGSDRLWVRRKGRRIVELIVMSAAEAHAFSAIDVTGTLDENFVRRIFAK